MFCLSGDYVPLLLECDSFIAGNYWPFWKSEKGSMQKFLEEILYTFGITLYLHIVVSVLCVFREI